MRADQKYRLRRKGIYLLPNLFTTLALFFGFYAIVSALKHQFDHAAIAIFIGMIFDGLDGRIARLTNTASPFGAEYDSLADMVNFGVAPAILVYSWALEPLGKVGWLAAFVYTAAAALRLARFNTQIGRVSKRFFQGVPSPVAAAVMAGMVWAGHDSWQIIGTHVSIWVAGIAVLMAVLMVSNIPYYSFKEIDLRGRVPFVAILIFLVLVVVIVIDPPLVLFLGFLLFTLSGPILYAFGLGRQKHWRKRISKFLRNRR